MDILKKVPNKHIRSVLIAISLSFLIANSGLSEDFGHIEQLFDLRNSITSQGQTLSAYIRKAEGPDVRTLERTFELNTSALTTIEAYFRIVKIGISTGDLSNTETVDILNEWLAFISNQCGFDIEYLDAALEETEDEDVVKQLNTAKTNIQKLSEIVNTGILENKHLAGRKRK